MINFINLVSVSAAGKRLRPRKNFHAQPKDASRAALPFPGSDRSIVKRSQQRIAQNSSSNPIEFFIYFTIANSFMNKVRSAIFGGIFNTLVKFGWGRNLIIKYRPNFQLEAPKSKMKLGHSKFPSRVIYGLRILKISKFQT